MKLVDAGGTVVEHTPELVSRLFDEELERILEELAPGSEPGATEKYRQARLDERGDDRAPQVQPGMSGTRGALTNGGL